MATVYYTRIINGRLYPKIARRDPSYAFAMEVWRNRAGAVKTKHIGIRRVPKDTVIEKED